MKSAMPKRLLSFVMVLAMVMSMVVMPVSAETSDDQSTDGSTPVCTCEGLDKCTADEKNTECAVCSAEDADLAACMGTEPDPEPECVCGGETKCTSEKKNDKCAVCSAEDADLATCCDGTEQTPSDPCAEGTCAHVAKVGETHYDSIAEALEAAEDNAVAIELLQSVNVETPIEVPANLAVTITYDDSVVLSGTQLFTLGDDATVTINGTPYGVDPGAPVDDDVTYVAQIGDNKYESLAEAIAAVKNGETITFLADISEDVTIKQVDNVSFTIDGADKTYKGTMTIDGNSRSTGAETLTIKNVNFVANVEGQISINTLKNQYAHNITVDGCTFTGTGEAEYATYGIYLMNAYNIVVKNTQGTNLYDLVYGNRAVTGFTAENITVTDSVHGIWLSYVNSTATFKNLKMTGILSVGVGIKNNAKGSATIENCTIEAEDGAVCFDPNTQNDFTLYFKGTNNLTDDEGNWLLANLNGSKLIVNLTEATDLNVNNISYGGLPYRAVLVDANVPHIYTFEKFTAVAEVVETGVQYGSVQEALNACTNGETVKLIADITYTEEDVVPAHGGGTGFGKHDASNPSIIYTGGTKGDTDVQHQPSNVNAVLDLNGHTITNNADAYLFLIMDNAKLTFTDSVGTGSITNTTEAPVIWAVGTDTLVTIESGEYTTASATGLLWSTHGADMVITGGEFKTTADNASLLIVRNEKDLNNPNYFCDGNATITVKGGTFDYNPEETCDDSTNPFTEFNAVAEGYKAYDNGDGSWTVQLVPKVYVAQIGETKYETLAEAVAAANAAEGGATVELLKDVTLGEKLTITGKVTISGEHTITRADTYTGTLFEVSAGAALTLDGGLVIDGANNYAFDNAAYAADLADYTNSTSKEDSAKWFTPEEGAPVATAFMITTTGGTVNLNKVTVQNNYSVGSGVVSAGANSTINLTGAKITHVASTQGNGVAVNASGAGINVVMNEGTVIEGNHVGGNHGIFKIYSGTVFTMNGGEIKNNTGWNSNGVAVGVYNGTFNLNDGTICGNSSVYGPNNGRNAAIYLHSGHTFTMTGGTVCHNSGRARGGIDAPYDNGTATITGGNVYYNESISGGSSYDLLGTTAMVITGGTYSQNPTEWVAEGYYAWDNGNGTWTVVEADPVAKNVETGKEYYSLQKALNEAVDGQTVQLLTDLTYGDDDIVYAHGGATGFGKYDQYNPSIIYTGGTCVDGANSPSTVNAVLDLDGYSITNNANVILFLPMDNSKLTIKDSGNGAGIISNSTDYPVVWSCGMDTRVTIENGKFTTASGTGLFHATHGGDLVITGGEFKTTADDASLLIVRNEKDLNNPNYFCDGNATITVTGGTFYGFNPEVTCDDSTSPFTEFNAVADGYCVAEDNGVYTVGKNAIGDQIPASNATCTKPAMLAHYECGHCGKTFLDAEHKNEVVVTVGTALGHKYDNDGTWKYDAATAAQGHYELCENGCGTKGELIAHTSWSAWAAVKTRAVGQESRYCLDCGYAEYRGVHVHELVFKYDSTYHWQECKATDNLECDHQIVKEKHDMSGWKDGKYENTSASGWRHQYCRAEDCDYHVNRPIVWSCSDNPKTGDYIAIAVGVMVISAAALVVLLVVKKKKK